MEFTKDDYVVHGKLTVAVTMIDKSYFTYDNVSKITVKPFWVIIEGSVVDVLNRDSIACISFTED